MSVGLPQCPLHVTTNSSSYLQPEQCPVEWNYEPLEQRVDKLRQECEAIAGKHKVEEADCNQFFFVRNCTRYIDTTAIARKCATIIPAADRVRIACLFLVVALLASLGNNSND